MPALRYYMAAAGHPVSELYPLEGAVSLETMLSGQLLVVNSRSSTQATFPSTVGRQSDCTCHKEEKEEICEICKDHLTYLSTRKTTDSILGGEVKPGEQKKSLSEQTETPWTLSCPYNLSETQPTSCRNEAVLAPNVTDSQIGSKEHTIKTPAQPVHRGLSGPLPQLQQVVPSQALETDICELFYHEGEGNNQEAENHSGCEQSMQLQQCNNITSNCQGAMNGEDIVQKPLISCACVSCTATPKMDIVQRMDRLPPQCDIPPFDSYHANPCKLQDTCPAYCHSKHVSSLSRVLSPPFETTCDIQHSVAPPSVMNQLTLPRLTSSVSETGLNAKHLLQCCNLSCTWISTLPRGAGPQSQRYFGLDESCSSPGGHTRIMTREIGTMTSHKQLKDVGVQADQNINPHIFPEICLSEEVKCKTLNIQVPKTDTDGKKKLAGSPKSPVKEVKWDAEGMTWEVYGASVDPVELGVAIQRHLELQIKETASHAAKMSHQNTISSQQSRWKRISLIDSILTPVCCTCNNSASVD